MRIYYEPDAGGESSMNTLTKAAVQGAACGLMIGSVLLIGGRVWHPMPVAAQAKQQTVPEMVRARSFQVLDTAGKFRAGLGVGSDGTVGLSLLDAAGKTRAVFAMFSDGTPGMYLQDEAGKTRAALGSVSVLANTTGEKTIRAESSLLLFDKDGRLMWQAP
jgi:hypothetical protein